MKTLKPEELPELMQRLSTANIQLSTRCLIEWQLHIMVRPGEAVKARWQDIDFEQALWTIPAEFMKKRRQHQPAAVIPGHRLTPAYVAY